MKTALVCLSISALVTLYGARTDRSTSNPGSIKSSPVTKRKEMPPVSASIKEKVPVSSREFICGNTWQIREIRFLQDNIPYHYKRGADGNDINFDTEYIRFQPDGTGNYVAGGINYEVKWSFINEKQTTIRYTVSYPETLTVTWEDIHFRDGALCYAEYYNRNGQESLATASRIAMDDVALYVNR